MWILREIEKFIVEGFKVDRRSIITTGVQPALFLTVLILVSLFEKNLRKGKKTCAENWRKLEKITIHVFFIDFPYFLILPFNSVFPLETLKIMKLAFKLDYELELFENMSLSLVG